MLRQDAAFARLSCLVATAAGGRDAKPEHFMPFADDDADEEATPEKLMRMFGAKPNG